MKTQTMRDTLEKARDALNRASIALEDGDNNALVSNVLNAKFYLGHVYEEASERAHRSRMRKRS